MKIDNFISNALRLAPCIICLDHVEEVLGATPDGLQEEDEFLREQLVVWILDRIDHVMSYGCPVVLVCETSNLHELATKSLLWIKVVNVERPDKDLRRLVWHSPRIKLTTCIDAGACE
jgi:flavin reductase (DIM6/NTAB) family NADH-FMN oxidoreductase RutF